MSALVSGFIGAGMAIAITAISTKTRRPVKSDTEGWKTLQTGWLINGTLIGSAGMSAFFGYIWLFVGSSRVDAEMQMLYALALFLVFGLCAIYLAWSCYAKSVLWKGNQLKIVNVFGSTRTVRFRDIRNVSKNDLLGLYRLSFKDGKSIRISKEMRGIEQLLAKLPRRKF